MPYEPSTGAYYDDESQTDAIYGEPVDKPLTAPGFDWFGAVKDGAVTAAKRITNYDLYEIVVKDTAPEDFTSPNVFTRAKAELNEKVSAVTGSFKTYLIVGAVVLLALVIFYSSAVIYIQRKI